MIQGESRLQNAIIAVTDDVFFKLECKHIISLIS